MIALSSHKPHSLPGEHANNQIAAKESWNQVFNAIYYFGEFERALTGPFTTFIPSEQFPKIQEIFKFAANQRQLVAIINADIKVTHDLGFVETTMERKQIQAATSKRWQVNGDPDPKILDKGLDIFIARPYLWKTLAKQCPAGYRIGHCEWDTWCLGMLMRLTHRKMADFTESKCVFHPVHEGRERPHNGEVPKMPEWLYDYAKMPLIKIRV